MHSGREVLTSRRMGMLIQKWQIWIITEDLLLRCLDSSTNLVGCRLKNPIRTCKSYDIIRKGERQFLNEMVRNINKNVDMFGMRRDTCRNKLADILDKDLFNECLEFMFRIKQARHQKILTWQFNMFDRLQHKSHKGILPYFKRVHNINCHNGNTYNSNNNKQWQQWQW